VQAKLVTSRDWDRVVDEAHQTVGRGQALPETGGPSMPAAFPTSASWRSSMYKSTASRVCSTGRRTARPWKADQQFGGEPRREVPECQNLHAGRAMATRHAAAQSG
jgi:hypothetical protein